MCVICGSVAARSAAPSDGRPNLCNTPWRHAPVHCASEACEAEYNKLLDLYESGELHKMPPGLAGKELSEHLDELEDRIYG